MYNSQETSTRIKKLAKEKGIQMIELQELCGLNKNAVAQAGKSQEGMKAKNLYAIAEMLECSVDYLLGRTDSPEVSGSTNVTNNEQNNVNGNNSISVSAAVPNKKDDLTEQFLQKFQQLDFDDKVDVMQYVKNKNNTV